MEKPKINIKNILERLSAKTKLEPKMLAVVLTLVCGVALLFASEYVPKKSRVVSAEETSVTFSDEEYVRDLEKRLESMISSINGVGKCRVMITVEGSAENIYLHNYDFEQNERSDGAKSYEQKDSYVIVDGENGENGIVIKTSKPEIKGAAVVCEGAASQSVKAQIIQTVTALLDISSARVSVAEMG